MVSVWMELKAKSLKNNKKKKRSIGSSGYKVQTSLTFSRLCFWGKNTKWAPRPRPLYWIKKETAWGQGVFSLWGKRVCGRLHVNYYKICFFLWYKSYTYRVINIIIIIILWAPGSCQNLHFFRTVTMLFLWLRARKESRWEPPGSWAGQAIKSRKSVLPWLFSGHRDNAL